MDTITRDFLTARRLAVVGVSRSPQKFGTLIYNELKERGFDVFGVNPALDAISGDPCYPSLAYLPAEVDGVVICIPPAGVPQVLREAAAAGIRKVWIQQGATSLEAEKTARELGITPVSGKCILMYAGEVKSIHAFHRFFARLFGQY